MDMQIDWDVPIEMDDGLVLRADVFRPPGGGRHPVLMTHGPYGKGLAFQDGFAGMWQVIEAKYPEILPAQRPGGPAARHLRRHHGAAHRRAAPVVSAAAGHPAGVGRAGRRRAGPRQRCRRRGPLT